MTKDDAFNVAASITQRFIGCAAYPDYNMGTGQHSVAVYLHDTYDSRIVTKEEFKHHWTRG